MQPTQHYQVSTRVEQRNRARRQMRIALEALNDAVAAYRQAAPKASLSGLRGIIEREGEHQLAYHQDVDKLHQRFCDQLDRDCWEQWITATGIASLLGESTRQALEEQIHQSPPPFTTASIDDLAQSLEGEDSNLFARSVVEAISRFDTMPDTLTAPVTVPASNDIDDAIRTETGRINVINRTDQLLQELDRICHVLDGRRPPITPYAGIIGAIESKLRGHNTHDGGEAINSYMHCHWNAAGRMRITFRRKDLLEAINRQVALAFGPQQDQEVSQR